MRIKTIVKILSLKAYAEVWFQDSICISSELEVAVQNEKSTIVNMFALSVKNAILLPTDDFNFCETARRE